MASIPRVKRHLTIQESDITIISDSEKYINLAIERLKKERAHLIGVIQADPKFRTSFIPYSTQDKAELIIQMQEASALAGVGPMASVAGVLADIMCDIMVKEGAKIAVVENGGEIMIHSTEDIFIGLFSKTTQVKDSVGFIYKGGSKPLGIGTSSGTFGHAVSLGKADTVTVFADSAGIADAAATRIANSITREGDNCMFSEALKIAKSLDSIHGVFITCGDKVAKVGRIPELIFSA